MNNSNGSGASTPRLVLTENVAYFKSPIQLSSDQGIETPHKVPVAPHPSPINMDIESSNPKSKDVFRTELLKACQLKIPEAIAKASDFDDEVPANLSYTEGNAMSNIPIRPIFTGHHSNGKQEKMFDFPRNGNSNLFEQSLHRDSKQFSKEVDVKYGKGGNSTPDAVLKFEGYVSKFNQVSRFTKENEGECLRITYSTGNILECLDNEYSKPSVLPVFRKQYDAIPNFEDYSDLNHHKLVEENQSPRITYLNENLLESPHGSKSVKIHFDPRPPTINLNLLDSMHRKDGASVFYDHATDHLEISKLLEVNSGWHETSICRSRSPCSDKMSTVAVCSSDASDISDGDLMDRNRSMDFDEKDPGDNVDLLRDRRPLKKQPSKSSAMRRFLNWRRSLKFRKRTASLDESQFPFFANRLDSYKTEFEVSV